MCFCLFSVPAVGLFFLFRCLRCKRHFCFYDQFLEFRLLYVFESLFFECVCVVTVTSISFSWRLT